VGGVDWGVGRVMRVLHIALKWGGVLKGSVGGGWAGVSVGCRPYSVGSK
jgi:hypothetical protein